MGPTFFQLFDLLQLRSIFLFLLHLSPFEAREVWPGDPAFEHSRLQRRRFNQESLMVASFNISGCAGEICGNLGGGSITPLLALQPPCSQQAYAEKILDTAQDKTNGLTEEIRKKLTEVAIKYRQAEKNSKPEYGQTVVGRNSLYCDQPPRHKELNGLVQAQDTKGNDPEKFFDPSKIAINDGTVLRGSQPNTFPFGTKGGSSSTVTATTTNSSASSTGLTATQDSSSTSSVNGTALLSAGSGSGAKPVNSSQENTPAIKSACKPRRQKQTPLSLDKN